MTVLFRRFDTDSGGGAAVGASVGVLVGSAGGVALGVLVSSAVGVVLGMVVGVPVSSAGGVALGSPSGVGSSVGVALASASTVVVASAAGVAVCSSTAAVAVGFAFAGGAGAGATRVGWLLSCGVTVASGSSGPAVSVFPAAAATVAESRLDHAPGLTVRHCPATHRLAGGRKHPAPVGTEGRAGHRALTGQRGLQRAAGHGPNAYRAVVAACGQGCAVGRQRERGDSRTPHLERARQRSVADPPEAHRIIAGSGYHGLPIAGQDHACHGAGVAPQHAGLDAG